MKFIRVFVFVLLLFAIRCSLYANSAYADECSNIDPNEFHSLRPYPAKPCQSTTADYAKFCGNTLTLQETITKTYIPGDPSCKTNGNKTSCSYIENVPSHLVTIDLSGANLPIMGNTEDVMPNASSDMTDVQKVNEYVSWYLNGITNKKEYSPTEDNNQIINFSGPINKLLPSEIQEDLRTETVKNAGVTRHDQIVGCVDLFGLGTISACNSNNLLQKKVRLSDWEDNLPPKRSEFTSDQDYWIEYRKWRGDACIKIFGAAFCLDVPWKANWPGNLFSYIPLSSTEDLEGNIKVDSASVGTAGVTNIAFGNQTPATLFFPHIQESDELGSILQDTYIAKDEAKTGVDTAVSPSSSCKTVDVRSNKGDSLFAKSLSGNLSYTASFSCDFNLLCVGKECPPAEPQTCSKNISIALSTSSNTPKIDDVWSRLVAGPSAIVKRMFPKLGTQIGTLKDIPGSTSITYSGNAQGSGELNLPHIGGISEYFLKGIQTMLRPKGYGEPISFGEITVSSPPPGEIDCDQSAPDVSLPNTIGKQALYELAIRLKGKEGNHVLECYNDAVKKSLAAGISPAFTFLLWMSESGGSNYNISDQDFGVNDSSIMGFTAQITRFLQLPLAYKSKYSQCFGKTKTDTEVFFDLYYLGLQNGQCVPGAGQKYIQLLNDSWNWFTSCSFPGYPFKASCY